MKKYEKNDITGARRSFTGLYIVLMAAVLQISNIIYEISNTSIEGITVIRSILVFIAVILLSKVLTKSAIKKYKITKSYSDNLRFNINLVIIAVGLISLFYFLYSVNSNIKEVKETTEYKMVVLYSSEAKADEKNDGGQKSQSPGLGQATKISPASYGISYRVSGTGEMVCPESANFYYREYREYGVPREPMSNPGKPGFSF